MSSPATGAGVQDGTEGPASTCVSQAIARGSRRYREQLARDGKVQAPERQRAGGRQGSVVPSQGAPSGEGGWQIPVPVESHHPAPTQTLPSPPVDRAQGSP